MGRIRPLRTYALLAAFVASASSCALIEHFSIVETGGAGGTSGSTANAASTNATATNATVTNATATNASATATTGTDATSSTSTGGCSCTNLISAYKFDDSANLGHDAVGPNHFMDVYGTPMQSTMTPNGLPGYSINLDGSSSVCMNSGFNFDSTADHTLCWWSRPFALSNETNQFAQTCGYDTWTQDGGASYLWRINNCNSGTPANLVVPSIYVAGQWVEICQTYDAGTFTREVTINGDTGNKHTLVDTVPIVEEGGSWCIGSYGGGGFWTGLIYGPMWFDRVLSDNEIANVYTCCPP